MASCKKDINNELDNQRTFSADLTVKDKRLHFESLEGFNRLVSQMQQIPAVNQISLFVRKQIDTKNFVSLAHKLSQNTKLNLTMSLSNPTNQETVEIDSLVEVPIFSNLLNESREIQVDETIYKVTPYGTFLVTEGKINTLRQILDEPSQEFYANPIEDRIYKVDEGIFLYDSFGRGFMENNNLTQADMNIQYILPSEPIDGGGGGGGGGVSYPSSVPASVYDNLETYAFGSKTIVGGWIEAIRGRDEVETINFDSNRRLRVNFYDASYGIYSAIGLSAKFQKNNWIGWSGTEANTLVIGWEFVDFQSGTVTPFTPPSSAPPTSTPISIPGTSKKYQLVDLRFLNKEYKYYVEHGKLVQSGIKELFDRARSILGPQQQNIAIWTYANLAKKVDGVLVSKDETIVHNQETLRKTFDWKTGTLSIKLNAQGQPSVSGSASKPFEINSASVYGIAYHGNTWKGIRIVKPKN